MKKLFKNTRRIVALILSIATICLCFTGCGAEVIELSEEEKMIQNSTLLKPNQNEKFKYNIYTEYIALTEYIGSDANVTIPEKLEDKPVLVINDECFRNNEIVTSITIPDTLYEVGASAFEGCINLQTIKFSNIMPYFSSNMCSGCESLKEVNIPESIVDIGAGAFADCTALTKITIPRNVETIQNAAFSGCTNVTDVIILDGYIVEDDTLVKINYLTINGFAFASLENAKRIIVPDTIMTIADNTFNGVNEDCMFYGYAPSAISTLCADIDRKYKFTEIKENDEIEKLIHVPYSQMSDAVKAELERQNA